MNIKDMSDTEIKALAFDEVQKSQIAQNNVAMLLNELKTRQIKPIVKETEPPHSKEK